MQTRTKTEVEILKNFCKALNTPIDLEKFDYENAIAKVTEQLNVYAALMQAENKKSIKFQPLIDALRQTANIKLSEENKKNFNNNLPFQLLLNDLILTVKNAEDVLTKEQIKMRNDCFLMLDKSGLLSTSRAFVKYQSISLQIDSCIDLFSETVKKARLEEIAKSQAQLKEIILQTNPATVTFADYYLLQCKLALYKQDLKGLKNALQKVVACSPEEFKSKYIIPNEYIKPIYELTTTKFDSEENITEESLTYIDLIKECMDVNLTGFERRIDKEILKDLLNFYENEKSKNTYSPEEGIRREVEKIKQLARQGKKLKSPTEEVVENFIEKKLSGIKVDESLLVEYLDNYNIFKEFEEAYKQCSKTVIARKQMELDKVMQNFKQKITVTVSPEGGLKLFVKTGDAKALFAQLRAKIDLCSIENKSIEIDDILKINLVHFKKIINQWSVQEEHKKKGVTLFQPANIETEVKSENKEEVKKEEIKESKTEIIPKEMVKEEVKEDKTEMIPDMKLEIKNPPMVVENIKQSSLWQDKPFPVMPLISFHTRENKVRYFVTINPDLLDTVHAVSKLDSKNLVAMCQRGLVLGSSIGKKGFIFLDAKEKNATGYDVKVKDASKDTRYWARIIEERIVIENKPKQNSSIMESKKMESKKSKKQKPKGKNTSKEKKEIKPETPTTAKKESFFLVEVCGLQWAHNQDIIDFSKKPEKQERNAFNKHY